MADDNKITITIDADSSQFTSKIGDVVKNLSATKNTGESTFKGMGMAAFEFNQALELGQKLLSFWDAALNNLSKVEAFQNQANALKNVGNQVGLTTEQIKTLQELVVKSTGNAISEIQAQDASFKLLNAGFQAQTIPNLTKYAELLEKARGIPFDQTINAFERALITGNTRGLMPFEIQLDKTGTTAQLSAAILKATQSQVEKFGDGYIDTAAKIKAGTENTWNTVRTFFAGITEGVAMEVWGDKIDKTQIRIKSLNDAMKQLDEEQSRGLKDTVILPGITTEVMSIEKARALITSEIAKNQQAITKSKQEENAENQKAASTINQPKELLKPVSIAAQRRQDAIVAAQIEDQMYQKSESDAQKHYAAQKQLIDLEFKEREQEMAAIPQTSAQYHAKLLSLEQEHQARVRALRVSDLDFQVAQEKAQLAAIDNNSRTIENAQQKHEQIMEQIEDRKYKDDQQKLRMKGLSKEQFDRQMEQSEIAHQARISQIQQQHYALTTDNIKRGWNSAMSDMEKRQGGWAGMTQRLGTQAASTMSKSFVDMAKAHKFSMDQMLNNFLEMIGESMIEDGSFKMLAGLFPPNPAMIGVGAAEVAAGSILVGASSSPTASASGGGSTGQTDLTGQPGTNPASSQLQRKQAQIVINGDLLNSRETANYLSQVLRENSDVTDYAIVAQGKNW